MINNHKMDYLSKKAQIGDTLTWFVAFIVIFFIMALFMAAIVYLVPKENLINSKLHLGDIRASQLSETSYFTYDNNIDLSKPKSELLKDFLNTNSELIYKWADSDLIFNEVDCSRQDSRIKNTEALNLYKELFNAVSDFFVSKNIKNGFFYIRTGNKDMLIETDPRGRIACIVDPNKSPNTYFFGNTENEYEWVRNNKYFLISDNGTLIMVILYDLDAEKSKVYGGNTR
ncbi:hypothetical protein HYW74_04880 [Candidatus Pacearchaeota archaeon]|nr:hypothetical protein [Candidatus Pacearchaeota archaeon]